MGGPDGSDEGRRGRCGLRAERRWNCQTARDWLGQRNDRPAAPHAAVRHAPLTRPGWCARWCEPRQLSVCPGASSLMCGYNAASFPNRPVVL